MPGDKPLIQAPKTTLHCLPSASYVPRLVHQYLHMHQHTHPHAFTPILHQSLTIHPALMGPHDSKFNVHLPGGTTKPSFAPFSAFYRATQKSFTSKKPGRWGALHVCIAWRIYYHEQLKKIQQQSTSLHRELTSEYCVTSPPDSVQQKDSDQPSCRHQTLDSPCRHCRKTAENVTHVNRSYLPELYTSSSSYHSRKTDWEKLELPQNLHWREKPNEKEKHGSRQTDTSKDLPLRDKSWDLTVTPELDRRHSGSLDRKRSLECDSLIRVKRVKQENVDDPFDPSHTHPSSHTAPVQHVNISDLSALYPDNSRCNLTTAPGGLIPYKTASWMQMWDKRLEQHSRQNALKDCSVNTWKAIRIPVEAQRQKGAFHGLFTPPPHFPLALRQQETVYLRGRDSRHESCQLHRGRPQLTHPGLFTTSYVGP